MKRLFTLFLSLLTLGSVLLLGVHIGQTKEKAKIPEFQEEE